MGVPRAVLQAFHRARRRIPAAEVRSAGGAAAVAIRQPSPEFSPTVTVCAGPSRSARFRYTPMSISKSP